MNVASTHATLLTAIKTLIEESKYKVALAVNAELTLLYWNVGNHINNNVLQNNRAEYGQQIIKSLARDLTVEFGKGWSDKLLRQCMQFAATFPDEQIVYALRRQLTWTHFRSVIHIDDPLKRTFYIQMCMHEKWSVRTFRQ